MLRVDLKCAFPSPPSGNFAHRFPGQRSAHHPPTTPIIRVRDSLAICETPHEFFPEYDLWPAIRRRGGGPFGECGDAWRLRFAATQHVDEHYSRYPGKGRTPEYLADIERNLPIQNKKIEGVS